MTLYLDTSALVKLFILEDHHETVAAAVRNSSRVSVSVVAYPEARSAFARKLREGSLLREHHDRIVHALDHSWEGFHRVRVTHEIAYVAGQLAEQLALRGFDAIHVASALRVRRRFDDDVQFLAFDDRLVRAARQVLPTYGIEE